MIRRAVRHLCDVLFQPPADVMVRAWFHHEGVRS